VKRRASLVSRMGFFLVAIGSAGGLGNLWRFPSIVGENGGGAFVLLYVILVFLIGLPVLVAELILGRSTGRSLLSALSQLALPNKPRAMFWGWLGLVVCGTILAYYSVISGWVLHFAVRFFLTLIGVQKLESAIGLTILQHNGWLQAGLASVHLLFCGLVVGRGVQEGLERFISWTLPLFGALLFLLVGRALSLPAAWEALRFLFYPDFAKLNLASLGNAIGQVLFTLSLGFGVMVTFGSYMQNESVPAAGLRVVFVDTLISLLSGLLLFPIVFQMGGKTTGSPGLLFENLPRFLVETNGGLLFGLAFFVCLYLAALGASIGLLEVLVANWSDRQKVGRGTATWMTSLAVFGISLIPAFSSSALGSVVWAGRSILGWMDAVIVGVAIPILAIATCLAVAKGVSLNDQRKYFLGIEDSGVPLGLDSQFLFPYWQMLIRWVAPLVISLGLILLCLSWILRA